MKPKIYIHLLLNGMLGASALLDPSALADGSLVPSSSQLLGESPRQVTVLSDGGPGSLRAEVAAAGWGETIEFAVTGTILLTQGALVIDKALTIRGPGAGGLVIDAGGQSRVFEVGSDATVSLVGITIQRGQAPNSEPPTWAGGSGGGIYNAGTLELRDCVIRENRAGYGEALTGAAGGSGGGIYNAGTLELRDCVIRENRAGEGGMGHGELASAGVGGSGGAGGGIYNSGLLRLIDCQFEDNVAGFGGEGFINFIGGAGGSGGAVDSAGSLSVLGCTFLRNQAGAGGHGGYGGQRGGVGGSGGAISERGALSLTNCTFSANLTGKGGDGGDEWSGDRGGNGGAAGSGGGLAIEGTAILTFNTLTGNRTAEGGGGGAGGGVFVSGSAAAAQVGHTIIANNTGAPDSPDISGRIDSQGYNLVGDPTGCSGLGAEGDLLGIDPLLGPLVDNGGITLTHALLPGSPAIDAGGMTGGLLLDQRGLPRVVCGVADIGAVETQSCVLIIALRPAQDFLKATESMTVEVILPEGANDSESVTVQVANQTPDVISLSGAVDNLVTLEYPAGGPRVQQLSVTGIAAGEARLSASASGYTDGAATFVIWAPESPRQVTVLSDGGPGSLRAEVAAADWGETIEFAVTGTILLTQGALVIDKALTIRGPGAGGLVIDADQQSRVFEVGIGATVSLVGITIQGGQAPHGEPYTGASGGSGGGIYNAGTLELRDCLILENRAGDGARVEWPGDAGAGGSGGGIYNAGTLDLRDCLVLENRAGDGAKGVSDYVGEPGGNGGAGGGVYNSGLLRLRDCQFEDNVAGHGGEGGGGTSGGRGGAGGGGGAVDSTGSLSVLGCTFLRNQAGAGGDGAYGGKSWGASGGVGGSGGAICVGGTLSLTNCTLSANVTGRGGNGGNGGYYDNRGGNGGAGGSGGGLAIEGTAILAFNTLAGNRTAEGGGGGAGSDGAADGSPGATGAGGAVFVSGSAAAAQVGHTIIANNTGAPDSPDISGRIDSQGHNLVGDPTGWSGLGADGYLLGIDPLLGPLEDNGGSTLTHALLPGSPAVNAGGMTEGLLLDQRGLPRVVCGVPDIGAVEIQSCPPAQLLIITLKPAHNLLQATESMTVEVILSEGANDSESVTVQVVNQTPALVSLTGAVDNPVTLEYLAGGPRVQQLRVAGIARGLARLSASASGFAAGEATFLVWAHPPSITTQPESLVVDLGDSAVFSVGASGVGTLTYQWRKDSVPLSGATQASLFLASVELEDAGKYDVVVSSAYGSVTSDSVALGVRYQYCPHGTPVTWLEQYGIAGADPAAAEVADTDGDGHPAWKEYVAGTVPTNPASVLRLTAEVSPEGRFLINYPTAPGRFYTVEVSKDTQSWRTLLADALGDGNPATFVDPQPAATGEARIYRLTVLNGPAAPAGMVWIEPGTFTMGSPSNERGRRSDEGPQTQVTISRGFWLGKHEVTQGQYEAVMGTNPSRYKGNLHRPVENVSWDDAVAYCEQLTLREQVAGRLPQGWEYRLPTEAQWEYACRAGTTTRFSFGDSDAELGQHAWYNGYSGTHYVGGKLPNPWGLYDMHGNVYEWCADWKHTYPGGSVTDPTGPNTGSYRVYRGGCWDSFARFCRSANRDRDGPSFTHYGLGFRVALVPVP